VLIDASNNLAVLVAFPDSWLCVYSSVNNLTQSGFMVVFGVSIDPL
jgi:hypothetical protein